MSTYKDMTLEAISALGSRTGSSKMAVENFIKTNYPERRYDRWRLTSAMQKLQAEGAIRTHARHPLSFLVCKTKPKKRPRRKGVTKPKKVQVEPVVEDVVSDAEAETDAEAEDGPDGEEDAE